MPEIRPQLRAALGETYAIERELGAGGMATVYLAHDLKHDRAVALKVLHPHLAAALGAERFQREIRLAARLQHPHVLTVLDSGEAAGQLWFTMPYVEGESLRDRLNRERQLPVEDALRIACEAAQGLEYAHRHGVIHRDVKPENLLLTEDGNTLVADFGIARAITPGAAPTLTQTGISVGTPAYMSPEQAAGERDLTPRTDVYSLGAVLYEMLAGEPPFTGPSAQAVIARRFSGEVPSVRRARPAVPEPIEHAVTRALAVLPADRWLSAAEFARALGAGATTVTRVVPHAPAASTGALAPLRRRPLVATLLLGVALGLGALFAWRYGTASDAGAGPPRLAVLPFENLGDSADAYFADGITDAVRGKLTALPDVAVIARTSSEEYAHTTKPPDEIARELGVRYLLTGTVRWARNGDGPSRVQVSPELVEVDGEGAPRSTWQRSFDAPLTDVFQVQSEIAGQVASALDVALSPTDQHELAERPTRDLDAYDAYLKGEAITAVDVPSLRRAAAFYEQAVARDSTFGIAWARLAYARASLYYRSLAKQPAAPIERALDRARALAPDAVETYRARAMYQLNVLGDRRAARAAAEEGLARYPSNPDLLRGVANTEIVLGDVESGVARLRRALALDPRSAPTLRSLGNNLLLLHRPAEARDAFRPLLAILAADAIPTRQALVMCSLEEGDLAGARRVLAEAPPDVDRARLLAYNAMYQDLYWVLDRAQQDTVLALPPAVFAIDGDQAARALAYAQILHQRGDTAAARRWADSARVSYEALAQESPENVQLPSLIGLALAYEGRYADAVRAAQRGVALARADSLAQYDLLLYNQHLLARIHILAGDHEAALDVLEPLLEQRYYLTPGWLRIDPAFAPLRGDPRFERLVK
ncbi:MAG TPA: protein kinase [Gemmatimonadaceae bacterium]|nr:protein kinase [Gemmatimonadaceae bacterium]